MKTVKVSSWKICLHSVILYITCVRKLSSVYCAAADAPNVETIAATVPVLSANVGLFGAVFFTAIGAAVIVCVCMCVCRNKKSEGR